jgi:DNA repair protein RadC
MKKGKKPYEGHRERLRQRFINTGFEGLHDYEIIELLLTYAIPRKDTKPIAKALIERFKTLKNVLDAPIDDLGKVEGMGKNSAVYIKMMREMVTQYFKDRAKEQKIFKTLEELITYLRAVIGGKTNEVVHVLYLNSKNELINAENLSEGTVSEAVAFPRRIVEGALKYGATSVILAHNHPGGVAEPSEGDDRLTEAVKEALKTVGITLQEHVIISEEGFYSYRKDGMI